MKKLVFTLLLCSSFAAFAQTNFSGKYLLDKSKLDLGGVPESYLSVELKVIQTKDSVSITRTSTSGKVSTEHLKYDGASFTTRLDNGNKMVSSFKWGEGKKTLNLERNFSGSDDKLMVAAKETWSLEDGGKTLVQTRDLEQSNGMKFTVKGYYNKQ